jgi:DNA-binding transcriptional LysR family regulator
MLNRMEMVRISCTAAEAGSFREAATRLGISPQGVTRAIQALETELGESLFHRNTRQVSITAFGQDYAKDARSALDHFDTLFRSHRTKPELSGRVGITAPHTIGRRFLIPFLQPLAAAHPDLQFDLRLEDQMTDAVEAHIDIGIRVGVIRDRRYIARALAPVPFYVVASPSLMLQRHGICSYTARSRVLYRSGCDWCTTTLSRLSQTPSYFPRAWGNSQRLIDNPGVKHGAFPADPEVSCKGVEICIRAGK